MNLNKVFILGNLTRDPETRALPNGQPVVSFGLATNRFYTTKDGEKKQDAEFHNVVAFGRLADISSQFLTKGSLVLIEGRLKTRSWQDSAGNTKYRTEIIAENLQLGPRFGEKRYGPAKPQAAQQEEIPIIEESAPAEHPAAEESPPEEIVEEQTEQKKQNPSPLTEPPEEEIDVRDIPF